MPPERHPPDDPQEWLNRARSNLARARASIPEAYLEDHCYDAQQAAEKAIKAVFVHRRLVFPFVHDLGRLLTLLEEAGERIPKAVRQAERLTRFAVETRYPGLSDRVGKREYLRAVRLAQGVLRWAEDRLGATR